MPADSSDPSERLLQQPAASAARAIAMGLLDQAACTRQRLGVTAETDAVHDFRVAIRRLRSWEQTFRTQLGSSVPRKLRRRLKGLAYAANPSRDAAVHLQWLHDQLPTLTSSEQIGVRWLIESLDHERGLADAELLRKVDTQFAMVRRRMTRALNSSSKKVAKRQAPRLAPVAAKYIVGHVRTLKDRLAAVQTGADYHKAHAARIAGKRLRYVLEPLVQHVSEIAPILDRLKQLQDTTGDLHDVHVFTDEVIAAAQRAAAIHAKRLATAVFEGDLPGVAQAQRENPMPGILALTARLRERGASCFETLTREWLNGAADDLLNRIHAIANTLRSAGTSYRPPVNGD